MTSSNDKKDLLLRYLLLQMDEQERTEMDLRLIADPDFADALQEAQHDLLDDFAADLLTPVKATRVRQAIEANASFARAAQMAVALRLASRHPGTMAKPVRRFRVPTWAMAACALIVAGAVAASFVWRRHTGELSNSSPASVASIAKTEAPPAVPTAPVVSPTQESPQHEQRVQPTLMATLVLPEGIRSGGAIPLHLQSGVQSIRIEWPVSESVEKKMKLSLAVLQDSQQITVLPEQAPRHMIDGTPVALFLMPAGKVDAGRYTFRITSSAADSNEAPLTELEVEISKAT